jgi:hypothetical protein
MPVESASHISELDSDNPLATDDVSEGDDHLQLIKTVLLADFGQIDAAVTAGPTDLNRTDITAEGTGEASKVLTADASANVDLTPLTVIADTQSVGDNSTKLATTAYADRAGNFATGSHDFGSVSADTDSATWDWAHGLGTEDVDFGMSILGGTSTTSIIGQGRDTGGYMVTVTGGSIIDSDVVGGSPTVPGAGELAFRMKNGFGGSQNISIKVWARVR